MSTHYAYDAIVIGAGPNGLAAAIVLARAGHSVLVVEAQDTIGGGSRTKELTLPGFMHDVCSAIHPLGFSSPFFRTLPLEQFGLEWIQPDVALAHPLDDGTAMLLQRSVTETARTLGEDAAAYEALMGPFVAKWPRIEAAFLGPLRVKPLLHPFALMPFGLSALHSASSLAKQRFKGERARALLAGVSAHALSSEQLSSAAVGILLMTVGHVSGWPIARGGSQSIADALADYLRSLGGEIRTGFEVKNIDDLPAARAYLFDVTPLQIIRLAGHRLPANYIRRLERYRYGPGSFKMDFALDGPIPWTAQECLRAGTVHLGGTLSEIDASERAVWHGEVSSRPYVLVAQQSLFDTTRAPSSKQTVWAYCHVTNGSNIDMSERIENQIERFAPGFRDRILARHVTDAPALERYDANYVGGDISGGVPDIWQLFTRPTIRLDPYTTPAPDLFICSSSTPPGGGVHGLCGYFAGLSAIKHRF
jgi:phytoene dehydrogenase-like protein